MNRHLWTHRLHKYRHDTRYIYIYLYIKKPIFSTSHNDRSFGPVRHSPAASSTNSFACLRVGEWTARQFQLYHHRGIVRSLRSTVTRGEYEPQRKITNEEHPPTTVKSSMLRCPITNKQTHVSAQTYVINNSICLYWTVCRACGEAITRACFMQRVQVLAHSSANCVRPAPRQGRRAGRHPLGEREHQHECPRTELRSLCAITFIYW